MLKNIISSFLTRGLVAGVNLAVLLISSKQLGAGIIGQVSLMIVNITLIQIVNEIYTGYSLVYFIAKFPLKTIYITGVLWSLACIPILNLILYGLNLGKDLWIHTAILSLTGTLGSFHSVIILAKEKVRAFNFLVFFQPAALLITLCICIYGFKDRSVDGYVAAMYVSFFLTLLISGIIVLGLINKPGDFTSEQFSIKAVVKNGFINQTGNLAHTLSNRINFYLIAGTVLVGVFSRASSLIESVWLISAGITPLVLTRVANQKDDAVSSRITLLLAKLSFILSCFAVIVIMFLPESFFIFLLGNDFSGVKGLMLYLSPGIICIGFSTVISHYFSGTGEQKVQLLANGLGLLMTICTAPFLISRYQLAGACYATSLSYIVQALVLTVIFMLRKKFRFLSVFQIKKDLELIKK